MKILCMSDLHGRLPSVGGLPPADLVLLAGDYCADHRDRRWYDIKFRKWLSNLAHQFNEPAIGIAGNHDRLFQTEPDFARSLPWTYLCDSGCEINGLKIWGSPWSGLFGDWAFMLPEWELNEKWALIPEDTDILITHGPPQGYGDLVARPYGGHVGSASLTKRILDVRPKVALFGHIHECHGEYRIGDTTAINASLMNEWYEPINEPTLIEI